VVRRRGSGIEGRREPASVVGSVRRNYYDVGGPRVAHLGVRSLLPGGQALRAAGVTKLVQETMFVTRARSWAGKFSLCETNPAHNERRRLTLSLDVSSPRRRAAREPRWAPPLPRFARNAAAVLDERGPVCGLDVPRVGRGSRVRCDNATPDPPGSVSPHPALLPRCRQPTPARPRAHRAAHHPSPRFTRKARSRRLRHGELVRRDVIGARGRRRRRRADRRRCRGGRCRNGRERATSPRVTVVAGA
jgi:hypothetical protein